MIATLCCPPPDNSFGKLSSFPFIPSKLNNSLALFDASFSFVPQIRAGIIAFSNAVNSVRRWWNWNTKPISLFLKADSSLSESPVISLPFTIISPLSALSNVPIMFKRVVFPAPDIPLILTISASLICKLISFNTWRESKDLEIFFSTIICQYFFH